LPSTTFLDAQGRELRRRVRAFDGDVFVNTDTEYDARGRVKRTSQPYFDGDAVPWNTPAYDDINRVTGLTAADPTQTTTTEYTGFKVTTTDAAGRDQVVIRNAIGQIVYAQATDDQQSLVEKTLFEYDVAGNLIEVTKAEGFTVENSVTFDYDRLGRRTETVNRDAGTLTYAYNGLGELIRQQTPELYALGEYLELQYDVLGRPVQRDEPEGTSTWSYDDVTGGNLAHGQAVAVLHGYSDATPGVIRYLHARISASDEFIEAENGAEH
jgi:YD repeat-containing protein